MTSEPFVSLSSEKGNGISMLTEKITALGTRLIKIQQGERENPTTIAVVWLTGGSVFIHRLCLESFQFICHFLFAIRWFTFATPCCKFYSPYICIWLQSATIWALWLAAPLTSFIHSFRFPMMLFSSAMLKPVSFRSWSTYVVAGLPLFLVPCFGSQSSRSLITSSFFLQQCPINRSLLIISASVILGRLPYSSLLVLFSCHDKNLFSRPNLLWSRAIMAMLFFRCTYKAINSM